VFPKTLAGKCSEIALTWVDKVIIPNTRRTQEKREKPKTSDEAAYDNNDFAGSRKQKGKRVVSGKQNSVERKMAFGTFRCISDANRLR